MRDTRLMRYGEGFAGFQHVGHRPPRVERALTPQHLPEISPLEIFHHDIGADAEAPAHVEETRHVIGLEARQGLGLASKTSDRQWIVALLAAAVAFGVKVLATPALAPVAHMWRSVIEAISVLGSFGVLYLAGTSMLKVPEATGLARRLLGR